MNRLKSRKLWITVATVTAFAVAEFTGHAQDPEAYAAVALLVGTYVFGQSWVDKTVVTEEIKVGGDLARVEVIAYAKNLEQQLAAFYEAQSAAEAAGGEFVPNFAPDPVE